MKQHILAIATMLTFAIGVKSQNYVPFPTENVQWNVYIEYSISESPADTLLLKYVLDGDTTVNQLEYTKLCLKGGSSDSPTLNPIGGLREENKKIYFFGNDFLGFPHDQELILYDFNKQVEDTVFHDDSFFSIIENIDSVKINEKYRKRYKISPNSRNSNYYFPDEEYWIEGIGSIKNGLLGHITMTPTCCYQFWEHICFKENNEVKYLNPDYDDCEPSFLINNVDLYTLKSKIKIYPNPIDKYLQIENTTHEKGLTLKIVDINGRKVIEQQLSEIKSVIKLDIQPGIYNVIVTNRKRQIISSQKVIKQ